MAKTTSSRMHGPWPHGQHTGRCPRCDGTGVEPGAAARAVNDRHGTPLSTCRHCDGRGRVIVVKEVPKP